jgi:hypothetical protein
MFPLLASVNNSSVIGDALSPTSGEETKTVKKTKWGGCKSIYHNQTPSLSRTLQCCLSASPALKYTLHTCLIPITANNVFIFFFVSLKKVKQNISKALSMKINAKAVPHLENT